MNRKNAISAREAFLASEELFSDAILYLLQRAEKHADKDAGELVQLLLAQAGPAHIRTASALRYLQRSGLITGSSVSFKSRIVESYEQHQLGVRDPSWFLDDKLAGIRFAEALDLPHALRQPRTVAFDDIAPESGIVVKLFDGSSARGCYLVHNPSRIWNVADKTELQSWEELRDSAFVCLQESGRALEDPVWLVEELHYGDQLRLKPARDLKAFCFYGEVELVRAIDRMPAVRTFHWDSEGRQVDPLMKTENKISGGVSLPDELVDIVRRVSSKIPSPFVRVDILQGEKGLYIGEFTPWPGTFAIKTVEWDRRLGAAWVRAEARLKEDMLLGKKFPEFMAATCYATSPGVSFPT